MKIYPIKTTFLTLLCLVAVLPVAGLAAESGRQDQQNPQKERLFVTKEGDRVIGTLTNPDENPRTKYLVKTLDGREVTIGVDELKNQREATETEVEYIKRRIAAADTVEAQWELAEWCRTKSLLTDRKTHLNRIIELQPDHRQARSALGYKLVNGEWMTQEQIQASRGYRYYKGRWRTEQQIASLERDKKLEKEEKIWYANLKRYVGWLGTDRTDEAMQALAEIKDLAAVRPVGDHLAGNYSREMKLLFIKILANIDAANPKDRLAQVPLAAGAFEDPDDEIRQSCLDVLKATKNPSVVDYFIGKLNVTLVTRKHKKDANMMINRAAFALGELGDPSAVGPLIKVLVTEHKETVTTGKPGQTSASFGSQGGSGLSMGSSTKTITHQVPNQDVLDALKKLTGVSFNFDVPTWQAWYDQKTRQATPDTRRGP